MPLDNGIYLGCQQGVVSVYDSVSSCQVPTRVKKQIAAIIFTDNKEINLHFQSVQAQCGHSDCDLFVVAFATFLCQRKPCANQLCPALFCSAPSQMPN